MKRFDMTVSLNECAQFFRENDNYLILSHEHPDGDTLGSAFALIAILRAVGKKCVFKCADRIPKDFSYITSAYRDDDIEPECIVAVDVADKKLLGSLCAEYGDRVNMCIDHHLSNTGYAEKLCLRECAATCELISELCDLLGVAPDKYIGECIYTGISTDTGCFRYQNTTAHTLHLAAKMYDLGINSAKINKLMFETKSKSMLALETLARETLEYYFDGRCAVISVTQAMYRKSGSNEGECYVITSLPRQIEGVSVGAVIKEKPDGTFDISVRTDCGIDASAICRRLGGGGHKGAAGCTLELPYNETKRRLLKEIGTALEQCYDRGFSR